MPVGTEKQIVIVVYQTFTSEADELNFVLKFGKFRPWASLVS
jgi:hypothetical protein